jgi:hypothetical protein
LGESHPLRKSLDCLVDAIEAFAKQRVRDVKVDETRATLNPNLQPLPVPGAIVPASANTRKAAEQTRGARPPPPSNCLHR